MVSSNKKERVWYDPPGVDPEPLDYPQPTKETLDKWKYLAAYSKEWEGKARRWRILFIGLLYLLTGVILYIIINYTDIPVEMMPVIFFWAGGFLLVIGNILYKQNGELRWGK